MRTEELVAMLARGAGEVDRGIERRRFALAILFGGAAAVLLTHALYGFRPSLSGDSGLWMFWGKLIFVGAFAATGVWAARRSARPGGSLAGMPWLLAAPLALMWLVAAADIAGAAPAERAALFWGQTWQVCSFRVALLSLPVFAALLWAMRGLAPTNLRLAGMAAGLCAGGLAALAYTLHCPELAAPFLGLWYAIGIAIPAGAGVLLGPALLRW